MMKKIGFIILCFLSSITFCSAQEEIDIAQYNNQIFTNLLLPLVQSFDLSYERTVANRWAIGLSGAIYGEGFSDFSTDSSGYYDRITNYEITPFVRFYLNGAQRRAIFLNFLVPLLKLMNLADIYEMSMKKDMVFILLVPKHIPLEVLGLGMDTDFFY
ncbi:hypothetical protein [Zobellia laminariae]|uniref:hypothetical protein n=1 Tax=Zobellia laminariae TaxID=248906 RepID=UPI0026F45F88|nr:hypothetical protein [Zobellia laminariae]WKX77718.1 hypothetical protein Q5W13_06860 [Zobellia laminariae]